MARSRQRVPVDVQLIVLAEREPLLRARPETRSRVEGTIGLGGASRRRREWPAFVWVVAAGRRGWVPKRFLAIDGNGTGTALRAYDTTELSAERGEMLEVSRTTPRAAGCEGARRTAARAGCPGTLSSGCRRPRGCPEPRVCGWLSAGSSEAEDAGRRTWRIAPPNAASTPIRRRQACAGGFRTASQTANGSRTRGSSCRSSFERSPRRRIRIARNPAASSDAVASVI